MSEIDWEIAGNRRNFGERGHTTCGDLIPQIHEGFRIRTNPSRTRIDHFLRESGHFGKESVAWMHCSAPLRCRMSISRSSLR